MCFLSSLLQGNSSSGLALFSTIPVKNTMFDLWVPPFPLSVPPPFVPELSPPSQALSLAPTSTGVWLSEASLRSLVFAAAAGVARVFAQSQGLEDTSPGPRISYTCGPNVLDGPSPEPPYAVSSPPSPPIVTVSTPIGLPGLSGVISAPAATPQHSSQSSVPAPAGGTPLQTPPSAPVAAPPTRTSPTPARAPPSGILHLPPDLARLVVAARARLGAVSEAIVRSIDRLPSGLLPALVDLACPEEPGPGECQLGSLCLLIPRLGKPARRRQVCTWGLCVQCCALKSASCGLLCACPEHADAVPKLGEFLNKGLQKPVPRAVSLSVSSTASDSSGSSGASHEVAPHLTKQYGKTCNKCGSSGHWASGCNGAAKRPPPDSSSDRILKKLKKLLA